MNRCVVFKIFLLVFGLQAYAADFSNDLRLRQSRWSFASTYTSSTNVNDPVEGNAYRNVLSFGASYKLDRTWSFNTRIFALYESVENEINIEENERDFFLRDLSLSISHPFSISKTTALLGEVGVDLPTGQASQIRGFNGIAWGSAVLLNRFFRNRLTLSNAVSGFYINNSYYFFNGTNDPNTRSGVTYRLGLSYRIYKGLMAAFSTGPRVTTLVDNSSTISFSNRINLNYHFNPISLSLFYVNGSYADQTDIDLWFVDEYRQIVGAGITYVF